MAKRRLSWSLMLLAATLAVLAAFPPAATTEANKVVALDTAGSVGRYTSLVLDASGNPVVSYYDGTNGDLKLLRCVSPNCSGGASITSPDTAGDVGRYPSLVIDTSDRPVVSYYDQTNGDLKLLRCGNPACTADNVIVSPDTVGQVGVVPSLTLDASGNPVVAYYDLTNRDLKVLRCGDATCTSGNTIAAADATGDVGDYPSLALDAAGNPVVSYFDRTNLDLKLLRCGDPGCLSGNTVTTIDSAGDVGYYTSLELDANGNPVISYALWNAVNIDLKVLRCGDPACTFGNVVATPDTDHAGLFTSLALDVNGWPVVSYWDGLNGDLKVLHCGSPDCSGANNVIVSADAAGDVGRYTSLALRGGRTPVVSYYDFTSEDLKLVYCPRCDVDTDGDGCTDGQEAGSDPYEGGQRDVLNPWDYMNPTGDGTNRIDDIIAVIVQYFLDEGDPAYDEKRDRTLAGPNSWNTGPPNGQIRVDDIINIANQYRHDCT